MYVPITILGGLPVVAEVWFSGPDYFGEYDSGCDGLYWQRKDGTRGAPLSQKVMNRVERDSNWDSYAVEQANDWLAYNARDEHEQLTPEYLALNPRSK